MNIFAETERLILREILPSDKEAMFELDTDPEVHLYLGSHPAGKMEDIEENIAFIRQQYIDNGIGRWALIEKSTGNFIGWGGLKLMKQLTNHHIDYYDLGYRLIKRYWGKGFATEAARAALAYGFDQLNQDKIYAIADIRNAASRHTLEKCGLRFIEQFDFQGEVHGWFEINAPLAIDQIHNPSLPSK